MWPGRRHVTWPTVGCHPASPPSCISPLYIQRPGDWEEHSLLLCNYLLQRGEDAYVVIGRTALDGVAMFVLSREGGISEGMLYDSTTGAAYSTADLHCPLIAVGMVFNSSNVWANVQQADIPAHMSWALGDQTAWKRMFTETNATADQLERWTRTVQVRGTHARARARERERESRRACVRRRAPAGHPFPLRAVRRFWYRADTALLERPRGRAPHCAALRCACEQVDRPAYARALDEERNDLEFEVDRALRAHIEERR